MMTEEKPVTPGPFGLDDATLQRLLVQAVGSPRAFAYQIEAELLRRGTSANQGLNMLMGHYHHLAYHAHRLHRLLNEAAGELAEHDVDVSAMVEAAEDFQRDFWGS